MTNFLLFLTPILLISFAIAEAQHSRSFKSSGDQRSIQHDTRLAKTSFDFLAFHRKYQNASKTERQELIRQYREHFAATSAAAAARVRTAPTSQNAYLRPKRDIAATVVGAAVSSVVANLMKNVEHNAQKQADIEPQGAILGQGEVPIANEIVPLPFAPIAADSQGSDMVPVPRAPVNSDVEVVIGNSTNTTTTTAAPSTTKKGFWATIFDTFKLFFGTVTNSVGGFFIDIGQRVTNFVEKRVKV